MTDQNHPQEAEFGPDAYRPEGCVHLKAPALNRHPPSPQHQPGTVQPPIDALSLTQWLPTGTVWRCPDCGTALKVAAFLDHRMAQNQSGWEQVLTRRWMDDGTGA